MGSASDRRSYAGMRMVDGVQTPASEAYRVLRTNLASIDIHLELILVTSSEQGEGKSLTCANLATVMSKTGQRVAVLDADLRMPSQHLIFRVPAGRYPELLEQRWSANSSEPIALGNIAFEVSPGLSVIAAGEPSARPTELLESPMFADLLQTLRHFYDVVIIDSPPVGMVTDAAIISTYTDGALLVLDYSRSHRVAAKRAVRALEQVNATILGVVLNNATGPQTATTYGYGSAGSSTR